MVGQASSLSIKNDGQDARRHQILFLFAITFENPYKSSLRGGRRRLSCKKEPPGLLAKPKEERMPYVNIKVTKEGVTAEQKAELIQGVTQLLFDVLGKDPQITSVVIDEVDTDNWGVGGESITVRRKKAKK
jgi:4-oxalocrotonate tautomerase